MQPLVSVVITSYNHEKYIQKAIESVYAQTYRNIEVIVVDDCSTDGSIALISTLQKRFGFRVIQRESNYYSQKNKSGEKPIIQAMLAATGKYIAVVDSDDEILPEKLEIQVALMEQNPQASLCYGGIDVFFEDGSTTQYVNDFEQGNLFSKLLIDGNFTLYIGSLIRTSAFLQIERSHPDLFQEDWDMFLRLAKEGEFISDPRTIARYRRHGKNTWFLNQNEALMYQNRMMILDTWQNDPCWKNAINKRWRYYLDHSRLTGQDIDRLLKTRPTDALLHLLKSNKASTMDIEPLAKKHILLAIVHCADNSDMLSMLYGLAIKGFTWSNEGLCDLIENMENCSSSLSSEPYYFTAEQLFKRRHELNAEQVSYIEWCLKRAIEKHGENELFTFQIGAGTSLAWDLLGCLAHFQGDHPHAELCWLKAYQYGNQESLKRLSSLPMVNYAK